MKYIDVNQREKHTSQVLEFLQDFYSRVNLIPVIGSGFSVPFGLPDWGTLVRKAAVQLELEREQQDVMDHFLKEWKYLEAVDVILDTGITEEKLQQTIAEIFSAEKARANTTCVNNYTDLAQMPRLRFMTTNYDQYINDFTGADSFPLEFLRNIKTNEFAGRKYDHIVIPLHGEIDRPSSIVLSRQSYERLYKSAHFEQDFQHLRSHYTFLFMGFSFDDLYFQSMFEKMLGRYEATHYILLEQSEQEKHREKIERLYQKYGVETIFFDASTCDYATAIHKFLKTVFDLKDVEIDTSRLQRLPVETPGVMTEEERQLVESGRAAIKKEQISKVRDFYKNAFDADDFQNHSAEYQVEIVAGLAWYYGYMRDDEAGERVIEQALVYPKLQEKKQRLTFMHVQLLWNLRDYDRCLEILDQYAGAKQMLMELFKDIVSCYKHFLPGRMEENKIIPVYGKTPRSPQEMQKYREKYQKLKNKYINEETYNLLHLAQYEDIQTQEIAYYYMGTAAGQLFHEHRDAIEYLNRAYELLPNMSICDELAKNYLELAREKTRYHENAKTYQIDVNSLLKAKVRFQYIMNFNDPEALESFYRTSGMSYLQTLCMLRDYYAAEEFYSEAQESLPDQYDRWRTKAEIDANYLQTLFPEVAEKLTDEDRIYMEFLCMTNRADIMGRINPREAVRIRCGILEKAKAMNQPVKDQRIVKMLLDAVFFLRDRTAYEWMEAHYPQSVFDDFKMLGFEDELYGRLQEAQQKMEDAFRKYQDYQGTFHILRGFYLRNGMKKEYDALYQHVIENPPDKMYESAQFFEEYIRSEAEWIQNMADRRAAFSNSIWQCVVLFHKYGDRIPKEDAQKKSLVESLKMHLADYSDYEDRIAWNQYMLQKASLPIQKAEICLAMLKLHIANMQYRKAEELLDEMKANQIPMLENLDRLTMVCLHRQKSNYYTRLITPLSPTPRNMERLKQELQNEWISILFRCREEQVPVLLSIRQIMYLYKKNLQKLLEGIPEVCLCYSGLINLQNALWGKESAFLRMILQGLADMKNLSLVAPEFESICACAPGYPDRDHSAETIQVKLYAKQNPQVRNLAGGNI